jgi:hypothetical protein
MPKNPMEQNIFPCFLLSQPQALFIQQSENPTPPAHTGIDQCIARRGCPPFKNGALKFAAEISPIWFSPISVGTLSHDLHLLLPANEVIQKQTKYWENQNENDP